MKTSSIVWTIIVIVIIVGAVVLISKHNESYSTTPSTSAAPMIPAGSDTSGTASSSTTGGTSTVAPQGTVVLNTSVTGALGTYLVAGNSMTLYEYNKDTVGVTNCNGLCASAWPPYKISASTPLPLLGEPGVSGAIATITRSDGSIQVTYNGMPLYFYSGDSKVGDATGQNVNGFMVATP